MLQLELYLQLLPAIFSANKTVGEKCRASVVCVAVGVV